MIKLLIVFYAGIFVGIILRTIFTYFQMEQTKDKTQNEREKK